jgi:hypothetical protein
MVNFRFSLPVDFSRGKHQIAPGMNARAVFESNPQLERNGFYDIFTSFPESDAFGGG